MRKAVLPFNLRSAFFLWVVQTSMPPPFAVGHALQVSSSSPPQGGRTRTAAGGRRLCCSRRLSSAFWLVGLMWDVHLDEIYRLARFNQAKAHVPFAPFCDYRRNYSEL